MLDLKNYWLTWNILAREAQLIAVKLADLESLAFDLDLLVYRGKLIAPSEYPCLCSMISSIDCFEEDAWMNENNAWTREEMAEKECLCPCHRYWWPD